ncbi:hypothetical protein Syun_027352 [Stephania yunnanensis]|uniref:Uncharacterized protein n=1 Tax=Stephania yunnanensis TaxID=152371 RepID=A0AAP0EFH7_9MAGN
MASTASLNPVLICSSSSFDRGGSASAPGSSTEGIAADDAVDSMRVALAFAVDRESAAAAAVVVVDVVEDDEMKGIDDLEELRKGNRVSNSKSYSIH